MAETTNPELKRQFLSACCEYTNSPGVSEKQWRLISKQYSASQRHYHSLKHIEHMLAKLIDVKPLIEDWHCIVFALLYHDYVYSIVKKNNEHKSALAAMAALTSLNFPSDRSRRVMRHIEFTSGHEISTDTDTNYFTDADLSILGGDAEAYAECSIGIWKEYWLYPNVVYNAGRRKVVGHFLAMTKIFKTSHFQQLENQARINLQQELSLLNN